MKLRFLGFAFLAMAGFFSFIFVPVKSMVVVVGAVEGIPIRGIEGAGYRFVWDLGRHDIDTGQIWIHVVVLIASAIACFYFSGNRDPK